MDSMQLWENACKSLRNEMSEVTYNTWISSALRPLELEGDTFYIKAMTDFYHQFVVPRYSILIENALSQAAGRPLHIKIYTPKEAEEHKAAPDQVRPATSFLNPKYTFESFVVGKSNEFAYATCLAVAQDPSNVYNPLFLYGGSGLGKTHLMHAVGHYILSEKPDARITYVTSDSFRNELISAIKTGQNDNFREKYRKSDVLLIDDIQFIVNATSTQEEFFHTFEALYNSGKQIVICSDRPPNELTGLEDRLVSRFNMGLIADIQRPDMETRIAILRKRAEIEMMGCDDDVLTLIAEHVESNIRELEGSLTKLRAYASLTGRPIDCALVEEALRDVFAEHTPRNLSCEDVMREVAGYYNVTVDDLKGPRRTREIVAPRQITMYLCRELTDASMSRIGELMGRRDHTTVLHGCDKVAADLKKNKDFESVLNDIRHRLKNK